MNCRYCGAAMNLVLEEPYDTGFFGITGICSLYECSRCGGNCEVQEWEDPDWLPGPPDFAAQQGLLALDEALDRDDDGPRAQLLAHLDDAERQAWQSLARYKPMMFGYWAGIWVHLNRVGGFRRPHPWRYLVKVARAWLEHGARVTAPADG